MECCEVCAWLGLVCKWEKSCQYFLQEDILGE